MKKLFLIFLSSFILSFEYEGTAQHLDFFHFFSIPEFQANDVKQTSDGGYLVVGGYHGANGGDFILVKTDSSGNEQWSYTNNRFDGFDGSNTIFSIEIIDGCYYLAGQIYDLSGTSSFPLRIYVVKMDSLRNKIWERQDTIWGGKGKVYKIKSSKDHKLLLSGEIQLNDSARIYCAKLDTNSQVLWRRTFYYYNESTGLDIIGDSTENNYIVSGYYSKISYIPVTHIDTSASVIISFDSLGSINWHQEYPDTISNGISSVIRGRDNNIYCGQFYAPKYSNPNNPNSSIIKIDSVGNLIYRKEFLNGDAFFSGIVEKLNGGFIAAYDFSDMLFLDNEGDSVSSLHLNDGYPFKNLILDSNNKGVIVGNYQTQIGQPFVSYILRISDTSTTNLSEINLKNNLMVYPNPSQGHILFHGLNNIFQDVSVEISDITGRIISKSNIYYATNSELDLSDLNNGIYFLKFHIDRETIINKNIIILK